MKKIVFAAMAMIMLLGFSITTYAKERENVEEDFWENWRGTTARNFGTELENVAENETTVIFLNEERIVEEILVENEHIFLPETGRVVFVDAIARFNDGTYENIAAAAEWNSGDNSVAEVYAGELRAGNQGTTDITICYGGIKKEFFVTVEETIDVSARIEEIWAAQGETYPNSMSPAQKDTAISIAKGMTEVQWTPTVDLTGWKGRYSYPAGVTVTGIPYSQTEYQKDRDGFLNSLSYSDFYDSYSFNGNVTPKYGNDCSGFVSFAWQIPRNTTKGFAQDINAGVYSVRGERYYRILADGRITNYDDQLMLENNVFQLVQRADALLQNGHIFMAAANDTGGEVIYVYEQTTEHARYASFTYEALAEGEYIPFGK